MYGTRPWARRVAVLALLLASCGYLFHYEALLRVIAVESDSRPFVSGAGEFARRYDSYVLGLFVNNLVLAVLSLRWRRSWTQDRGADAITKREKTCAT
jgi:hypothetical protein